MSSTEDFINSIMDKDFNSAQGVFADLMNDRITDALEQQKIAVAGTMFGEEEDEVEEEDLEEFEDDEDLEEDEE